MLKDTPLVDAPRPGQCLVVTGRKRDGKSWYVYHEIFLPFQGPSIYCDPKGQDAYMVSGEVRYSLKEIQEKPANKIIFRPAPGSKPELYDAELEKVIEYLIDWKKGYMDAPLLVVIDEAQRYMGKAGMVSGPDRLIQTCAVLNCSTCVVNPDYSTMPRQLFFQADAIVLYTGHPVIFTYLEERLSTHIPDIAKAHLAQKYHGICYDWEHLYLIWPNGAMRVCEAEAEVRTDENEDNEGGDTPGDTDGPDDDAADSPEPDDGTAAKGDTDGGDDTG